MRGRVEAGVHGAEAFDRATRIAVVAALSATSMLFASVASAYLVRRSFGDWSQPLFGWWPVGLLAFGILASIGLEVGFRNEGTVRVRALRAGGVGSGLYLLSALAVIASISSHGDRLTAPHNAFIVLLLSIHVVHSILGVAFSLWIVREAEGRRVSGGLSLVRLVTHFLTILLFAIVLLLFVRA